MKDRYAPAHLRAMRGGRIGRRTVLRGGLAGGLATVGLPMLEVMLNPHATAYADGSELPTRFIMWFFGQGFLLDRLEPTATGPDYEITEQLAPLGDVKDYVSVLTGMQNRCEEIVTHFEGMTVFNGYTMADLFSAFDSKAGGPTVDQLIVDAIGPCTPVPSIQLAVSKRFSVQDMGTTAYVLSHRGTYEPLYPEVNPQEVWRQLFYEFVPKPDDSGPRTSVLDAVREDARDLKMKLGAHDKERIDAHLDAIRNLENKIGTLPPQCALPDEPQEDNTDDLGVEPMTSVNDAMNDLIAYAFTCDITRVASLIFTGLASETIFQQLGQGQSHHANTHDPARQDEVHDSVLFIMERFGDLLRRLQAEQDIDGNNLLDSSIVYCSSDCAEGLSHSVERQPILIAGHGRNELVYPGIHYQETPAPASAGNTSDALLACLQAFDPEAESIGAGDPMSTTPLSAIVA